MNGKPGNLAEVRRQLAIGDIVDDCASSLSAELLPDITATWHLVETHPSSERKAAEYLIARRFGVYIPEIEETVVRRGRKFDRKSLMFTGYIFVFVWDVLKHQSRIEAVPGVARLMLVDGERPAVISDEIIDQIRAVENSKRPIPGFANGTTKKKRWRKSQKEQDHWEIVSTRAWSPFLDNLNTIDSNGRNQALWKALGLS